MTSLTTQMQEILELLRVKKPTKERFLKAAEQFEEKDQKKILQFLMKQLEALHFVKNKQLKNLRKFLKDQKGKFEEEEKKENLQEIEKNLYSL